MTRRRLFILTGWPFNAPCWIAVGLNLLGSGFAYTQLSKPSTTSASPT
jgi:hypothetical protein